MFHAVMAEKTHQMCKTWPEPHVFCKDIANGRC